MAARLFSGGFATGAATSFALYSIFAYVVKPEPEYKKEGKDLIVIFCLDELTTKLQSLSNSFSWLARTDSHKSHTHTHRILPLNPYPCTEWEPDKFMIIRTYSSMLSPYTQGPRADGHGHKLALVGRQSVLGHKFGPGPLLLYFNHGFDFELIYCSK